MIALLEGVCCPGDDLFTLKRISTSGGLTYQALATKMLGLWRFRSAYESDFYSV